MNTEKHTLKNRLLEACINKQISLVDDFKSRITLLLSNESLGNEEAYDNNELSQNSQSAMEIDSLNKLLEFANDELEILKRMTSQEEKQHEKAELGALVVTDHGSFFISVSAEQIGVGDDPYIGISTHSALFGAMKGKQKGESFSCNGKQYKIKNIF